MRWLATGAGSWWRIAVGYLSATAGVALCTLFVLLTPEQERLTILALLYIVVVAGATILGGLGPGLLAAVLAFLAINMALAPPDEPLRLDHPAYWMALLIFPGVAALLNYLLSQARREAASARRREREAWAIAELAQVVATADGFQPLLDGIVRWAGRTLEMEGCGLILLSPGGQLHLQASAGRAFDPRVGVPLDVTWAGEVLERSAPVRTKVGTLYSLGFPLLVGGRPAGVLWLLTSHSFLASDRKEPLLVALIHQAGLAIEQAQLRAEVMESEILRRSDALKSTLLTTVSHELRTPLAVIKAAATSLQETKMKADDGTVAELAEAIDQETDRLHHLVGDLLDLSRIEGGALRLELGWYDLGELVRETASRMRLTDGQRRVEVEVAGEVPPVQVDYLLLDRVMSNLLGNAMRYTPPEHPVRVSVCLGKQFLQVTVADEGPGIPEHDLERVFEKFHRVQGRDGGVGLGLAICKGFVEAHGGRIWGESPLVRGQGAAIHFTLPIQSSEAMMADAE